ncbi:MAG: 23S rRNA (uracil(1939)-C(5))-methyltransferase RlmD [Cyanobacteria bacterium P01_F01_bin.4]
MVGWQQGQIVELTIDNLSNRGDGVGRWDDRVVFVADTVPGDRVRSRLTRVKPSHGFGKLVDVLEPSPQRVRPACIVADKCGGCQWQQVAYEAQLTAKHQQIIEALQRMGGLTDISVEPVLAATPLAYRNKATYPLARASDGTIKAGYYRKGSHQLINLNQCPVQDTRLNPLLANLKQDIQDRGWSIYNETQHRGKLRHLSLRIGHHTGQILLTLVSTGPLDDLEAQAQQWLERYPTLVGVGLNLNPAKTNAIFGPKTDCIIGQPYLEETFVGLRFQIRPATFFQVNTVQAERLVQRMITELNLQGTETLVDVYCGVGTLTLPLAQRTAHCIGIESQPEAVAQAQQNAALNGLQNVDFYVGKAEMPLAELFEGGIRPDIVVLDPPRKGCDPAVLDALLRLRPGRIAYMSCNPITLARDLKLLCAAGYRLTKVQPADFFPQTAHVECVAFLVA